VTVTLIVNPNSFVNQPADKSVCNGDKLAPDKFTPTATGTTFYWANDRPDIGLEGFGVGDIDTFVATNTTDSIIHATITVTPVQTTLSPAYAYVPNDAANNVSVINASSNTVVATISVGAFPIGVTATPDGSKVYISNAGSNNVSVINTTSNSVMNTIPVGQNPYGLSVNPDGTRLYVANYSADNVYVVNTSTDLVIDTIDLTVAPVGVSVSPDGSRLFVAGFLTDNVYIVNTGTNKVIDSISLPPDSGPAGVAISPDGSKAYVTKEKLNYVSVVNTATHAVQTTIAVNATPLSLAITPNGNRVYVANYNAANVSVINTATNLIIATVAVGTNPSGVSVSPDGSFVYVVNNGSNNVSVINTSSNTVVATIPVGSGPYAFGNFITGKYNCPGIVKEFTITVKPTPDVTASPSYQSVCSEDSIDNILFTSNVNGAQFDWTRDNASLITGIAASGSDSVVGYLDNPISAPVTVTFTITPKANGCLGIPINDTVLINPEPDVAASSSQDSICSNESIFMFLSGAVSGTSYSWTRDHIDSVAGIGSSGISNIFGSLTTATHMPVPVSFFITPFANGCAGKVDTEVIVVAPLATVTASAYSPFICSGSSTSIALQSPIAGTHFSWTVAQSGATGATSGSGDTIRQGLTATGLSPGTAVYTITPAYINGRDTCMGTPVTVTINVLPIPNVVVSPQSQTKCSGSTIDSITFSGSVPGTTYLWTRDNTGAVSGTIGANGIKTISGTLTNNTNVPITVAFTVTPTYTNGGTTCTGLGDLSTVQVDVPPSKPVFTWLNLTGDSILCGQSNNINFNVAAPGYGVAYQWSCSPATAQIKDLNDPNTVVSFPSSGTYAVKVTVASSMGCEASDAHTLTVSNVAGLEERRIFLKQPGSMLIYADNSMEPIDGYQWGYDSLWHTQPDTAYGPPVSISDAVYQFFSPSGKFLGKNGELKTDIYAFWVLLRNGDCYSRVYYNGAYAPRKMLTPTPEDNTVQLRVIPNPNDGLFAISLGGNIYGDLHATVRNALGQAVYHASFSKTIPIVFERLNIDYLPAGLYYLDLNSSDLKKVQTRFIIQR
jgi:YVTN family beta-propeller protein